MGQDMGQDRKNLALLIDFDNVALGARDAGQRFDIKLLLQRMLEKGKVLVKKAYADWHFYKEHMSPLHESAVELIEIPMPRISGKNSADIKLVVDAMDLCYSKDYIDTFVIVSGDSDFSPLVSKLRENNKWVIGVGVKNSSSKLLIGNCDEFIFYDDIFRHQARQGIRSVKNVPAEKRDLFDFLVKTIQSLLQESRGVLYSSLVKDTMTRKQPDFNERAHGYSNFGDLLEDARNMGLLIVERDAQAGGTWVVHGVVNGASGETKPEGREAAASGSAGTAPAVAAPAGGRSSRRRRRSTGRGRAGAKEGAGAEPGAPSDQAREPEAKQQGSREPADRDPAVAAKAPAAPGGGAAQSSAGGAQAGEPVSPGGKEQQAPGSRPGGKARRPRKKPAKKAEVKAGEEMPAKTAADTPQEDGKKAARRPAKKTGGAKKTAKKAPQAKKTTRQAPSARKTAGKKAAGKKAAGKADSEG